MYSYQVLSHICLLAEKRGNNIDFLANRVHPVLKIDFRGYHGRGGPKTFGRTKNLNSIRSLGNQTTCGTNQIQEAQKLDNPIELDKNFDSPEISEKSSDLVSESKIDMVNFMRFLGGLNRPKICGGKTKIDFKDWAIVLMSL